MGDVTANLLGKFCVAFSKATAHPTRGALVARRNERNIFFRHFFFAKLFSLCLWYQRKKRAMNLDLPLWRKGNPPLVRFPSFRRWRKFTLRWRFRTIRLFRSLRRATQGAALRTCELLKKLEQNFFVAASPRRLTAKHQFYFKYSYIFTARRFQLWNPILCTPSQVSPS